MSTNVETSAPPQEDPVTANLLKGAVDLHCHSGPSVMPRRLDHIDALEEAAAAGLKAVLFKDHYYTVAPIVALLSKRYADRGVTLLSGVPLNNTVGGINRYTVDHGLKLGARLVWMPTFSAANHLAHNRKDKDFNKKFPDPKEKMLEPTPLTVLDSAGKLIDEVKFILDMIAEKDVVLSGGHLNIKEIWPLFEEAKRHGVRRLLVNHPTFVLDATLKDVKALSEFGAYIEHSACMFVESKFRCFEPALLKTLIDTAGVDRTFFGSDLGQCNNPTPVQGMRDIIKICLDLGYSVDDVRKMVSTNASALIGL
jgi:hypothetical protein